VLQIKDEGMFIEASLIVGNYDSFFPSGLDKTFGAWSSFIKILVYGRKGSCKGAGRLNRDKQD